MKRSLHRLWPRFVHRSSLRLGFLVVIRFACDPTPSMFAQSSPADGPWSGSVRCVLDVQSGTYSRREIQTWTLTGAAPTISGAFRIYAATWSVSGQGSLHRTQAGQLVNTQWTVNVPPQNVQLAIFIRASDQKLIFRQWSPRLTVPGGVTGTKRVTVNGIQQPPTPISAAAEEWVFGWIASDPALTDVPGTSPVDAELLPAEFSIVGAPRAATCTWQFNSGSSSSAGRGSRSPAPQLLTVAPDSADQGTMGVRVTLSARGTHWQTGTTTVDFGPGISVQSLAASAPDNALAILNVASSAAPGKHAVTITTPTNGVQPEVVGLPDIFTVRPVLVAVIDPGLIPLATLPGITQAAPNTAAVGATAQRVTVTGFATHFVQGTTTADFGAGVTVVSVQVNSPTSAIATLNVLPSATVGLRTVAFTTGSEIAKLTNGFTLAPATVTRTRDDYPTHIVLSPSLTKVAPNSGSPGAQNLSVTLTGQFTRFAQGTTTASFGAGITVASLRVDTPTSATAVVSVASGATLGPRAVTLTTGTEVVTLASGFTVAAMMDTQAPTSPTGVRMTDLTLFGFTLHWIAATDNVRVAAYDVLQDGVVVQQGTISLTYPPDTIAVVGGLAPGSTHRLEVVARDSSENRSAPSSPALMITQPVDSDPPSAPTHVRTTGTVNSTFFWVSWNASTDNFGVLDYDILLTNNSGVGVGGSSHATLPTTGGFLLGGLNAHTSYHVRVRARDLVGNLSDPSAELVVQTP